MNDIKTRTNEHNKELLELNKKMKKTVKLRQNEINQIDQHYDKLKTSKIQLAQNELADLNTYNQKDVNEANLEKEEKLHKVKEQLDVTKNILNKERERVILENHKKLAQIDTDFYDINQTKIDESKLQANKIHDRATETLMDLAKDSQDKILTSQQKAKTKVSKAHTKFTAEASKSASEYNKTLRKNQQEFDINMNLQKNEHLQKVNLTAKEQKAERSERIKIHQKELSNLEKVHQELIKSKMTSFEQKYNRLVEDHKNVINRAQFQLDHELQSIAKAQADIKAGYLEKSNDSFYQVSMLSPIVTDMQDHYLVSMSVPEYEKDDVLLSANKREIKVTLSRDYQSKTNDENGSENKISKNEVYAKTMNVADILDFTNIEKKYENGVLTFKVLKA